MVGAANNQPLLRPPNPPTGGDGGTHPYLPLIVPLPTPLLTLNQTLMKLPTFNLPLTKPLSTLNRTLKQRRRRAFLLAAFALPTLLVLAFIISKNATPALADWFDPSWAYRKAITVTNNTTAETNVYISFDAADVLDTSDTAKFQSDCDDIRFTNQSGELLNYVINSGCSSASTDIDVTLPTFPAGTQTIFLYYGNPSATPDTSHDLSSTEATNYTLGSLGSQETTPGPIAYWKFDEGQGQTVQDSTSNNNDGTLGANSSSGSDDPTWATEDQCIIGKCLSFDGGDYVSRPDTSSTSITGSFTLSAWINTTITTGTRAIIDKDDSSNRSFYLNTNSGKIRALVTSNGSTLAYRDSSQDIATNKWYHVASVYNSTSQTLDVYINGIIDNGTLTGTVPASVYDNNSSINIGYDPQNNAYFTGKIDDVKIYPFARTAAEIKSDYARGQAPHGSTAVLGATVTNFLNNGLVGYWSMDETSGTTVADKSGNGNTGTLTNAQEAGTSDASGNTTTTLIDSDSASLSTTDDAYNGMILNFTSACGSITSGTQRLITDYTGSTKTITVSSALAAAPNSCAYSILHQVGGKFGSGVQFEGTNDYVNAGTSTSLDMASNSWSGGAWVQTSSTTSNVGSIFSKRLSDAGGDDAGGYELKYRPSTGLIQAYNRGGSQISYTAGQSTAWRHIFTVYDHAAQTISVYLNGSLVASGSSADAGTNPYKFIIGSQNNSTLPFTGTLDDVRVYNRALSASEVSALYSWAPGPIGHWKMDDKASGNGQNLTDSSGNNKPLITSDGANDIGMNCNVTGKIGGACSFDGVDDITTTGSNSFNTGSGATIGMWIKANSFPALTTPFRLGGQNANAGFHWIYFLSSSRILTQYAYGPAYAIIEFNPTLSTNTWYYITFTHDYTNQVMKFYLNGILFGTSNLSYIGLPVRNQIVYVGAYSTAYPWDGSIDDVKVYDYVRTPAQILQDMQAGSAPTVLGTTSGGKPIPIAWYKFDEGQGQTANDSMGQHSDAQLIRDGDMERVDTSAWTSLHATLSKSTTNPHGGTQTIHVVADGTSDYGRAYQVIITTGKTYRVTGYGRGDGTNIIGINDSLVGVWTGTNSTSWQPFDVTFTARSSTGLSFQTASVAGYADFDDVEVREISSGNPGTLGAAVTAGSDDPTWKTPTDCKQGGCLSFDGGDYVFSSSLYNPVNSFSLSLWYKPTTLATNQIIFSKWNGSTQDTYLVRTNATNSDELNIYTASGLTDTGSNYATTTNLDLVNGTWTHIVIAYDGTQAAASRLKLYANGVAKTLTVTGTIPTTLPTSTSSTTIGGNSTMGQYSNGTMDDFKLYNFALTADQVKEDYNLGFAQVLGGHTESADLSDGAGNPPVAEWKFDEKMGTTANDTSGNSHNGTITGTTWKPAGICKEGSCLSFPGTAGNYVDVTTTQDFNSSFSVSTWVNVNSAIGSRGDIIGHAKGSWAGWFLYGDTSGYFRFGISDSVGPDKSCVLATTSSLNTWHHLEATVDQTNDVIKCYLDGKLSNQTTTPSGNDIDSGNNIRIGQRPSASNYPFGGLIDHVTVYNYARTPAQVAYDYNRGAPIAWYKMDECQGVVINNSADPASGGTSLNGTLTIGPSGEDTVGTCNTSSTAWGSGSSGKYSSAMSFDGTDDYIDTADISAIDGATQLSGSAWVKLANFTQDHVIFTKDTFGALSQMVLWRDETDSGSGRTDTFSILVSDGSSNMARTSAATNSASDSNWHHLTFTFVANSATGLRLYLDGQEVPASPVSTVGITALASNSNLFRIGESLTPNNPFNGLLDDVKIWNYALSATQVKKEYNQGSSIRFGP